MDAVLALSPGAILLRVIMLSIYFVAPVVVGVWVARRIGGERAPLVAAAMAFASIVVFHVVAQLIAPTDASNTEEGEWGGWAFVLAWAAFLGTCQAALAAFVAAAVRRRRERAVAAP